MSDRLVDLVSEGFDLDIRIGDDIAPNLIARKLADNQRILCASPAYLQRHGVPKSVAELAGRACLVIRSAITRSGCGGCRGRAAKTVKVTGALASNHGEIVHQWCLDGQGVALRSAWDVKEHRQRQIGAHSAGVFSAGQHLGGVRFPAGNVGESAGDGRILRDYFREHYGETGAASENPPRP